ncbi:MAG: hypothetical protein HQK54_14335, partial [Oligoflexales bacterium]|nr:hypothetical protein [Oligoflexales bacterium]
MNFKIRSGLWLLSSGLFFTACGTFSRMDESKTKSGGSGNLDPASIPIVDTAYGTFFDGMGKPVGGCGVPEEFMVDENGKPLPFIALNVQNTPMRGTMLPRPIRDPSKIGLFNNGKNCGRWVEIKIGNDCSTSSHIAHEGKICLQPNGESGPEFYDKQDNVNGK